MTKNLSVKDGKFVYIISCSCGTPYIGEIGRLVNQRICEHVAHIKHGIVPQLLQNMQKRQIIISASKRLGSLQGLTIFIIVNLGRPWKLKRDLLI